MALLNYALLAPHNIVYHVVIKLQHFLRQLFNS